MTQQDGTNNGSTFWEVVDPPVVNLELLSGSKPLGTENYLTLDNAAERVAIAIKNVSDYKNNYLSAFKNRLDFGEFDTSSYLDSLNTTKANKMEPTVAMDMSVKTAKMIIADEIQNLLAKEGNASADDVYALIRST